MNYATLTCFALASSLMISCAGRNVKSPIDEEEKQVTDAQRIENLTNSLSRTQARVEELDAKLAVMEDKLQAAKTQPEKPIEPVSAEPTAAEPLKAEKPVTKSKPKLTAAAVSESAPDREVTQAFMKAMKMFKAGNYSASVLEFNRFTEAFPEHALAGSAQFYSGESYFRMNESKLALGEYQKVVSSFPNSPRASTAMARIAQCQQALGYAKEANHSQSLVQELFAGNPSVDVLAASSAPAEHAPSPAIAAEKPADDLSTVKIEPMTGESDSHEHEGTR